MDWALLNNSANMLTHLRNLGYAVPSELIERDPHLFGEYLLCKKCTRTVVLHYMYVHCSYPLWWHYYCCHNYM